MKIHFKSAYPQKKRLHIPKLYLYGLCLLLQLSTISPGWALSGRWQSLPDAKKTEANNLLGRINAIQHEIENLSWNVKIEKLRLDLISDSNLENRQSLNAKLQRFETTIKEKHDELTKLIEQHDLIVHGTSTPQRGVVSFAPQPQFTSTSSTSPQYLHPERPILSPRSAAAITSDAVLFKALSSSTSPIQSTPLRRATSLQRSKRPLSKQEIRAALLAIRQLKKIMEQGKTQEQKQKIEERAQSIAAEKQKIAKLQRQYSAFTRASQPKKMKTP